MKAVNINCSEFKDLYFKIFLQLDFDSLKAISLTCKKFSQVINSNLFCKLRFENTKNGRNDINDI